jgi:CheY-like chemotaxis protein
LDTIRSIRIIGLVAQDGKRTAQPVTGFTSGILGIEIAHAGTVQEVELYLILGEIIRGSVCLRMNPRFEHPGARTALGRPYGLSQVTTPVRVLVVEDFAPFRQFILSILAAQPDIKVVGEVSNGFAAVNKSLELQPDLVLLDIGLPGLDGINAARQIRNVAPACKVVFLSQESSADIVQEALSLGARGYVLKIKAASELLRALEAVLLGKTFVSSTMGSQ